MVCKNCGSEITESMKFCRECGGPVQPETQETYQQSYQQSNYQPQNPQQPNYSQQDYQQPNYQPPNPQQPDYSQQDYQQPNYQPQNQQQPYYYVNQNPTKTVPLPSVSTVLWWEIICAIPFIGWIFAIIYAVDKTNPLRSNICKAKLIISAIILGLSILGGMFKAIAEVV